MSAPAQLAPARYIAHPAREVHGDLTVPGDKSISHRALMLGALARGDTEISGFLAGEDCLATLAALEALGVRIERSGATQVLVHGVGPAGLEAPSVALDMGNAGTAMRLFMGLLAARPFRATLIGDASLMRRPMERVAVPLRQMGADIRTRDGLPPVEVHGRALRGIEYALPVASAQVKSAVLLAGLSAQGTTAVLEPAPSRDHTERMLVAFGATVRREGPRVEVAGGTALRGTRVRVPADISSAAFFLVAGCLGAQRGLLLRSVGVNPTRTGALTILRQMGADIRVHPLPEEVTGAEPRADIEVRRSALQGIEIDPALVPLAIDELPVLFIAAACAQGTTRVRGAQELRVKESDRLATMAAGLAALGVTHELRPDGILIEGGRGFSGGVVDSRGDHRIAMSFAVASLAARAPIEIIDVANVATSFPGFLELARTAGLALEAPPADGS